MNANRRTALGIGGSGAPYGIEGFIHRVGFDSDK